MSWSGILSLRSIKNRAHALMKRFGIQAAGPNAPATTLSGLLPTPDSLLEVEAIAHIPERTR